MTLVIVLALSILSWVTLPFSLLSLSLLIYFLMQKSGECVLCTALFRKISREFEWEKERESGSVLLRKELHYTHTHELLKTTLNRIKKTQKRVLSHTRKSQKLRNFLLKVDTITVALISPPPPPHLWLTIPLLISSSSSSSPPVSGKKKK